MKRRTCWRQLGRAALAALLLSSLLPTPVVASDHDDGETPKKSRNRSLTDLYVFREGDQTGVDADNANLIIIMNTNPRSVARQHYFFAPNTRYEINISRVASRNVRATGFPDVTLRFEFAAPTSAFQQTITMNRVNWTLSNGSPVVASTTPITLSPGLTTPAPPGLGNPNPTAVVNTGTLDGHTLTVFAGLREDPFFFDVEQFFKVRALALGRSAAFSPLFRPIDTSVDFAKGYNVNAIVVRVPKAFLQQGTTTDVFDVWLTISTVE